MTSTELTEDAVSAYLRQNPHFLASWFVEHADDDTLKTLARKLKQDAISLQASKSPLPPPVEPAPQKQQQQLQQQQQQQPQLRSSHNHLLTVQERSVDGQGDVTEPTSSEQSQSSDSNDRNLQKYTTFSKVGRNSITSMIFRKYLDGDRTRRASVKKDLDDLRRMSEEELFMELIRDIASELDVSVLCHKILQNVSILTNSDRGSLFLVRGSRDNKYLVSKLFDVTESSTLEQSIHTEANEIVVPFGVGIAGNVALKREPININDVYADPRFNQEVDKKTGYRTHSILSMPILNYEGEVIGVAQIINKITGNHEFTKQDEDLFQKYLTFCGIGITNAQLFEMSVNEFKRNQLLLHLARGIFEEQSNLEKLVQKIMLDAQDLLKCEKCSVYLLEDSFERKIDAQDIMRFTGRFLNRLGTYSRHSNLAVAMQDPSNPRLNEKDSSGPVKLRESPPTKPESVVFSKAFELHEGQIKAPSGLELAQSKHAYIARCTVVEGEPLNIEDLAKDGRFGKGPFTDASGFTSKSVLCMPIHNSERTIIGVTQLINKINGQPFDDNDEHIIEAFSIFTGLGIHNCQMYEHACQLMAKQSVALEVLSYHATASKEEAERFSLETIPTADDYRLYTYDFDDLAMKDDDTIRATIRMFVDANLINTFKIPYETMCRWVCTVKKNYRPVTYHNWRHAFNVCQTMFTMLYTGELRPKFDAVEVFALMAACLCHDLDHRGTNNAFQVKVASPLAMLYSTSVLEHHHFDHCIMILNSEGNNIFQSFPPEEYRRAIKILEHAILSTDLALYFKKRGDFKTLVESGERNFKEEEKKDLLKAMMMTACDVAAITKPWKIQKEIAQLVTAEFFEQGDIEKTKLGQKPIPMMDREKKDELPTMQVGFIDSICTPVYELFAKISDPLRPLNDGCASNRKHWEEMASGNSQDDNTDEQTGEGSQENKQDRSGQSHQEPEQATQGQCALNGGQAPNSALKSDMALHSKHTHNNNTTTTSHISHSNSSPQSSQSSSSVNNVKSTHTESTRTPQQTANVNSVNTDKQQHSITVAPSNKQQTPTSVTPAIEEIGLREKDKKRTAKSGESKKSSKSSKSNFCAVS
ncbi:cGMP-specific 3',5'-cyclic phosphodiesterase isoform X2 [Aplysia californica]|uniref:Phosphodiesterase n=1 Tax=Aplysia californica TaxID=6500 RepID=A0ABM1ACG1_APLCA|nr:cGMP-specific 3',5'-cyclic phosphodiesterase isoform X2 [Aplysia californica]